MHNLKIHIKTVVTMLKIGNSLIKNIQMKNKKVYKYYTNNKE
jgi:hypothetical protein